MMLFKPTSIVALLLLLLTGDVLASYGCYRSGLAFGDVGNDGEVNLGLVALCDKLAGSYAAYSENSECHNVNDHGIYATILVTEGPQGSLGADISKDACYDVITQVKNKCPKGGAVGQLTSNPDDYGGDWFKANVMLDPNKGSC